MTVLWLNHSSDSVLSCSSMNLVIIPPWRLIASPYLDKKYEEEVNKFSKDKLKRFRRLDKLSKEAEKNKQFNVSVQAEYRSGQLAGMYVDKREVTVSGLEGMSRDELENKLKELSTKIDG